MLPNLPSDLQDALTNVKTECKNVYAISYLNNLEQSYSQYGLEGIRIQLLYILSNTQHWRGEKARQSKKILRKYSKKGVLCQRINKET